MIADWRVKTTYELGRTANHLYLCPHPLLRPFVAHYTVWTASPVGQTIGEQLTLVPDASGCIVLHCNDSGVQASLWGATTRVVTVSGGHEGAPLRIFIEFRPGGLFRFTGMGQLAFTDSIYPLADIAPRIAAALCRLPQAANTIEDLVERLNRLLLPILLARETPAAALSAVHTLQQAKGLLTVEALSIRENYSPRHLTRLLDDTLGMGPKQFARLLRVNAAVNLLASGRPLTYLAQESGFYDQAHFIRDFKAICGVTPGGYRERMSDFYNEPLKF